MDIRQEFLDFFRSKDHRVVSSMPLVPEDPSLMFTNAGMVQFKDIFTGSVPVPQNSRATSCQLCIRAGGKHNDLENVGYTARHHTLFEMLGNFSFGDYFKEEAISNAWEFITVNLALSIDRLWVTIHDTDDEAYDIWTKYISKERILRFGDKDNFWSMGETGPCGPCSEIFYDQGEENFSSVEDKMGGDGDRFLEIWNLVFMQYERTKKGELIPLPKPSIDTGMGLERVIAIKEGVFNNFDSSTFTPLILALEKLSPTSKENTNISSYRVIVDHLRACSFMLSQGILFSNEGRGYVNRRILRRAVRHGYLLGFREPFMAKLYETLCETMGEHYRELFDQKSYIKEQFTLEEERFFKTIESGIELFNNEVKKTKNMFSGEIAFKLYDEKGFPLDLTQDMLKDMNLNVDIKRFDELMKKQKEQAKSSWKGSGDIIQEGDFKKILESVGKNNFVGYHKIEEEAIVLALLDKDFKQINALENESSGWVMLDSTPFYATSGGQEGDTGFLIHNNHKIDVLSTQKFFDLNLSNIQMRAGNLKVGAKIQAKVLNRKEIEKHHSATHLLQSALKKILGDTVSQAGSLNDDKRLRFDFTYPKPMTKDEIEDVENLVNSWIAESQTGTVEELPIEKAKEKGAIAMFGEKYGDFVRVVSFGDSSVEFCGGTHVENTSLIGSFYIIKESGVSAGVRRIEAVVGKAAVIYAKENIQKLNLIEEEIKNKDVIAGINKLKNEIKVLKDNLKNAHKNISRPLKEIVMKDVKVIIDIIEHGDIKELIDELKNGHEKVLIMLFHIKNDKVLLAAGSKNTTIKAGDWVKNIAPFVGGGGGGRPDFAQAGGKDPSQVELAKNKSFEYIKTHL